MKSRLFISHHLPFIAYGLLVGAISSIPDLSPPPLKFIATDKVAHFIEYSLFAFLAYRSFFQLFKQNNKRTLLVSSIFLFLFAIADEIYQYYVPGRYFDIFDILTDVFGASLVLILLYIKQKRLSESQ